LNQNTDEFDHLIDAFTINVSRFFRDSLTFDYISKIILPDLFLSKDHEQDNNLRIWSAGCSFGEEPYSMAIILKEFLKKEKSTKKINIFATDIDRKALACAADGSYNFDSVKDVKFGILKEYFTAEGNQFLLDPEIQKTVHFSFYDLLDKKHLSPPESIFGGFDLVLCRNVLIYFEPEHQKEIFRKLHKSLKVNGYLILGEAEVPNQEIFHKLKRETNCCKIYRKIG
jgi:chemotaxis protein methyltransferase CheR